MTEISIEELVIQNLILSDSFIRQAIPFIKEEYFTSDINRSIFKLLSKYFNRSNVIPEKNVLLVSALEDTSISTRDIDAVAESIQYIYNQSSVKDIEWLLTTSETWCRDRAMYLNISKALSIYDGSDNVNQPSCIPDLMKEALAISFKTNIRF
jgi:hypothetical protein